MVAKFMGTSKTGREIWMRYSPRHRLSIRQAAYAVQAIFVLSILVTSVEIYTVLAAERARLVSVIDLLLDSAVDGATRAAIHVDDVQASVIVDGLIKFRNVQFAQITTDLNRVLAERRREFPSSDSFPLPRSLFADHSIQHRQLVWDRGANLSAKPGHPESTGNLSVIGTITLEVSPEAVAQAFLNDVGRLVGGILVELVLLALVLVFIFHQTLTRPLLAYANDLSQIDPEAPERSKLRIPAHHEHDELGLIVSRNNELLDRVSEQRDALMHREKVASLGSMLAGVAHELNNPLAILTAQAELLEETATDDATRERARKILGPAERCARIVQTFLALARQQEGKKENLIVGDLINDVLEMLEFQLHADTIKIDVDISSKLPLLWGDPAQLTQVLVNILVNAQQALINRPQPREISVAATPNATEDQISIRIVDNGPGIPEAIRRRVFEPFFTTRKEQKGTGLGLSYCFNIVADHQGTIVIDDDPREPGTAITISLPVSGVAGGTVATGLVETRNDTRRHRVLVVDDETGITTSIVEMLDRLGHHGDAATSARDALRLLARESYDAVICDLRMPEMDGPTLYKRAIVHWPEFEDRFIFITGDSFGEPVRAFLESSAAPCITKPFRTIDIQNALNELP